MSRRILQIIPTLGRGGAEKQLVLLAEGLAGSGFEVHVCALTQGGPLEADLQSRKIAYTVIGKAWRFDPRSYFRLKQFIQRLKPDLVQTWMFAANSYGRAAALAAGVRGVIASELCIDPWKGWQQLAIDRYLARRSAAVICNSRGVEQFYARAGVPTDRLRMIYSGAVPASASSISREDLLAELGLPRGSRLIGAVGRLWPQKRVEDLIWAADLLKVIRDDVHLLVIGDGPRRAALERFRRNCHIEDRVHFLGARADVPRLMPHFDLLWLASGYEGLPNAIMEAMACAVPVVATDIWGNRELVVHGTTGFLVPVGDRAGLARHAYKILQDPALGQALGAAGKARIGTQFTTQNMVDAHAALYREVLD